MTARSSRPSLNCVLGFFPELLGVGGVQEAGRQTAIALASIAGEAGWDASFMSLNDATGQQTLGAADAKIAFRGFARSKIRFVLSGLRQARGNTRIVLAAHPHLALPAAVLKCKVPHLKIVVMSHGIEVWKPLPMVRQKALLAGDLVLAPSRDTSEKLIDVQGVPPAKIRKLAWPLDATFLGLSANPAELRLPAGYPAGCIVLTVGRWAASEGYKGVDELIKTLQGLQHSRPELKLVAVGNGDDLPRLRNLAEDCGVADRVHFLTHVSREELAACYARADIFALPSTGEGFGMVFLEAMAFGRPVVGAACGGTIDLVEDGVNGLLVPPHDAARLERALLRLCRDPVLRADLGQRGAETVRRKFTFEVFRSQLRALLAECGLASNGAS